MKEIKLKEKEINDKYLGITKIKELQSDDDDELLLLQSTKRQKIEDPERNQTKLYKSRIDR